VAEIMRTDRSHIIVAMLIVLACSTATYTVFNDSGGDATPIRSDLANIDSPTVLSNPKASSPSNLIYHIKMVAVESLFLTKKSINIVLDTTIKIIIDE